MTMKSLRGCGTALVTPFNTDGSIDEGALRALVDWQIEQGIHFLVPCGSTASWRVSAVSTGMRGGHATGRSVGSG